MATRPIKTGGIRKRAPKTKRPKRKSRRLNSQQRADAIAASLKDHLKARGDDHLDRRSGLVVALVSECCDDAESPQHAVQEITMAQQTIKSHFDKLSQSATFQRRFGGDVK